MISALCTFGGFKITFISTKYIEFVSKRLELKMENIQKNQRLFSRTFTRTPFDPGDGMPTKQSRTTFTSRSLTVSTSSKSNLRTKAASPR